MTTRLKIVLILTGGLAAYAAATGMISVIDKIKSASPDWDKLFEGKN